MVPKETPSQHSPETSSAKVVSPSQENINQSSSLSISNSHSDLNSSMLPTVVDARPCIKEEFIDSSPPIVATDTKEGDLIVK